MTRRFPEPQAQGTGEKGNDQTVPRSRKRREPARKVMREAGSMNHDPIFEPLKLRTVTVKNRIFRSNISGRFDNYDGSGTRTRINWELKFARGGVGAIITSYAPVHGQGRILPNYARIDSDDKIPFWREM